MELKRPLSFSEQVIKLKQNGIVIADEKKLKLFYL